jgi:LPS export ABC transporter protein LptC
MKTLAIIALSLLALTGCSNQDSVTTDPIEIDSSLIPDAQGSGLRIYLYERGRVTAEILSETMVRFEANDSTLARVVDIDAFDSTGQRTGTLVGDSAVIRENDGRMDVYGHVVFSAEDGTRLETDYLLWNPDTGEIETEAFVRITRGKDWATGWIFRADQDLKRWRILKDFKGTFFGAPETP